MRSVFVKYVGWLFRAAGIYGLLVLPPNYFLENRLSVDFPPAITHPEYFYGFLGVAIAWQFAFLVIGSDPVRYRAFMLVAVIEKFSFAIAALVLFAQGRLATITLIFGMVDLLLGLLFCWAYCVTPKLSPASDPSHRST